MTQIRVVHLAPHSTTVTCVGDHYFVVEHVCYFDYFLTVLTFSLFLSVLWFLMLSALCYFTNVTCLFESPLLRVVARFYKQFAPLYVFKVPDFLCLIFHTDKSSCNC